MSKAFFRPPKPLFVDNPYQILLPQFTLYCKREEIDALHRHTCRRLGIEGIYPDIRWSFNSRFRAILGQAEYWCDESGKMRWKIQYASKYWIPMGVEARRNTIVHEICHLAVEKLYGHCARPKDGEERVLDHGEQWQELMLKCGEEPFLDVCC